ncbi:MAG: tRNA (adenosine(37)-N6)-dimethylallyltransferase MiaA [Desulfonatronovibrionaceae bacterium]
MSLPRIVCILGVTGTGKSSLALDLARKFEVAVINFDSRQVYRELPIITAQPDFRDKKRCPHRLYGFLPADERMDAGSFISLARQAIWETISSARLPVLVGGTGLYLRSLIHGLAPIPDIPDEVRTQVRLQCDGLGSRFLYSRLTRIDPDYAAKIHPHDTQRICRALEVYLSTGTPLSEWHRVQLSGPEFAALKLGLAPQERKSFRERLRRRIRDMLQSGAVEEVKGVLERYGEQAPGLSGIGAPELIGYIRGETSLKRAEELWLQNTAAYAKRQLTWFKKEKEVCWLPRPDASDEAVQAVGTFLSR